MDDVFVQIKRVCDRTDVCPGLRLAAIAALTDRAIEVDKEATRCRKPQSGSPTQPLTDPSKP